MKQIELTQGQVALVDDKDFEELSKHKWYAKKRKGGGFTASRAKKTLLMHRAIMNAPKGMEVD